MSGWSQLSQARRLPSGLRRGDAEEVVALDQDAAGILAIQPQRNDRVDRLAAGAMVLAHRKEAAPSEVRLQIGVAQLTDRWRASAPRAGRRLRSGRAAGRRTRRRRSRHPSPASRRRHTRARALRTLKPGGVTSARPRGPCRTSAVRPAVLRSRLGPVHGAAIERRLAQPDLGGRHQLRRDRRPPGAVGRDDRHRLLPVEVLRLARVHRANMVPGAATGQGRAKMFLFCSAKRLHSCHAERASHGLQG